MTDFTTFEVDAVLLDENGDEITSKFALVRVTGKPGKIHPDLHKDIRFFNLKKTPHTLIYRLENGEHVFSMEISEEIHAGDSLFVDAEPPNAKRQLKGRTNETGRYLCDGKR